MPTFNGCALLASLPITDDGHGQMLRRNLILDLGIGLGKLPDLPLFLPLLLDSVSYMVLPRTDRNDSSEWDRMLMSFD